VQLPEVERVVRWPELVAMARAAEEVGFDSIWLGDHLLYRGDGRPERGPWEAWTTMAALAAVTERVEIGPLVACLAFHPPGLVAKMAAAVDEVSGGRFVLGVGAGWNEAEFRAFGLPFDRLASRFADAFPIVRGLVQGERVTHRGELARADDAVLLPPLRRPVPLMVGSVGERVLTIALPHVQRWNTWFDWFGNTPEGFASLNARIDALVERTGAAPVERSACVLVELDGLATERPEYPDSPPLRGSTERITDGLRALGEAGADEVICVVNPIDERSIRVLGEVLACLDA
jgi:alkanesulfonate monooxygenase SsuD/methylene tetrahydromethanopterin reductase-like flavin-dependent oxidoreductase (luciferase family)